MYGIIVCPRCNKAKIVDISNRTTKCNICGKSLRIDKLRILYKDKNQGKLRNMIGVVNAEIDGKKDEFIDLFDG